jgi:hypothetical protein
MKKKILLFKGKPCIPYIIKDGRVLEIPIEALRSIPFSDLNFLVLQEGGEEIDDYPNFEDG